MHNCRQSQELDALQRKPRRKKNEQLQHWKPLPQLSQLRCPTAMLKARLEKVGHKLTAKRCKTLKRTNLLSKRTSGKWGRSQESNRPHKTSSNNYWILLVSNVSSLYHTKHSKRILKQPKLTLPGPDSSSSCICSNCCSNQGMPRNTLDAREKISPCDLSFKSLQRATVRERRRK